MTSNEELDNLNDALIEEYLLFLRGRGPQPDLSLLPPDRREAVAEQLKIVKALADRGPQLPPLEQDPVARRLGLIGTGASPTSRVSPGVRHGGGAGGEALEASLDEVAFRFQGRIAVERTPTWSQDSPEGLWPVAQCSVLAEAVAVFVEDTDARADLPEKLTRFFLLRPEVSAACVSSPDAEQAAIFAPADVTRSLSPASGWLDPHRPHSSEPLGLALSRFFEQRLPRWDQVAATGTLATMDTLDTAANSAVEAQIESALRARPRLGFKKDGQRMLAEIDQARLASLVVAVQTRDLDPDEFVEELTEMAGAGAP